MVDLVRVYGPPGFSNVARVLACLLEKDVHFQLVPLNIAEGQHKTPDYLKIQPFGLVPAFQDESICLFESRAIARYICDKYPNQGNKGLFGTNPLDKASIDQWVETEGQTFNAPSTALIYQLAFARMLKSPQDTNVIKQNEDKLGKVLDVYEKSLGENRFLAGNSFTLADLTHLPNLQYLVNNTNRGELVLSRKNVARWWGEISSQESWKKVVEMQKSRLSF